jgi:hypothetical protein
MRHIDVLINTKPELYIGSKAILCENNSSVFVTILGATRHSATIRHSNGQLQKTSWGKLLVDNDLKDK